MEETAALHPLRRGRCTRGAGAPRPRQAPARPARCRPTADRQRPGQRKRSRPIQRPARGRRRREPGWGGSPPSPPPPRCTDPLAADRTAPDARGCPATPTARVYPGGARRRQRMAGQRPTGPEGGGAAPSAPPPLPFPSLGATGATLRPPGAEGAPPLPQKGPRRGGGGCGWTCTPRAPAPPATCSSGGHGRRASPHQRAGATRAPSFRAAHGGAPEQYGGRAPHDPPMTTAHSGRAEGGFRSAGAPGGAVHGPPLIPPNPGRPRDPDGTRSPERTAPTARGGPGWGTAGRHPEGEQKGRGATPPPPTPPNPPTGPQASQGGWSPLPPPERGAGARPAPPPQPLAPTGTAENKRARANAPRRRTDRAEGRRASTNRSGMGGHAPHGQNNASDTRFVACAGKAEGRNEAERPPALRPLPWLHKRGSRRTPPPPQPAPGTRTPRTRPTARSPHRACRPRGQSRAPTPPRPRPQHGDSGPVQPAQWAGSRWRGSA